MSRTWPDRNFNGACRKVIQDHFIKVCKGLASFLTKKLFTWLVLASP